MAKWAEAGCEASLLVCTDGSKGTWDAGADIAALVARRQREQSEAARRLGALGEVCFLGEVDGELEVTMALRSRMAKVIRELRPDVVLGPRSVQALAPPPRPPGCRVPVHGRAGGCPRPALLPRARRSVTTGPVELLLFECEAPDHVEQVAPAQIEAKVQALLAHESQFVSTHGISPEDDGRETAAFRARVVEKCRDAGRRAGLPYGEAFKRVERV